MPFFLLSPLTQVALVVHIIKTGRNSVAELIDNFLQKQSRNINSH